MSKRDSQKQRSLRRLVMGSLPAVLLLATVPGHHAAAAQVDVDPAFGYRIGDSVVAVGRVAVDERAALDVESMPKIGRVNGWLTLQDARMIERDGARQIVRVFQVTASATEPRILFLPKAELKFRLDGRELREYLEPVPISVSPLTSVEPVMRNGFGALRPDRDVPEPRAGEALRRAASLAAALVALALLWLAVRRFARRRLGFAPFANAAARLRAMARGKAAREGDPEATRRAFRIMHDAFNEAAGQAVFASQAERFLAAHPRLAAEALAVRTFFERSDEIFFVAPHGEPMRVQPAAPGGRAGFIWLLELARRLAALERPGR